MNDYSSKLWLQKDLNRIGVQRAQQAIRQLGRALPCRVVAVNGSFVTVAFEVNAAPQTLPQITIPKAESPWIRVPTQIGDYGITVPADVAVASVSGQGTTPPTWAQQGNLSALLFLPIASKSFSSVNPNAAYIAGPQGAVIQTQDGTSSITVNESGITLSFGGKTVVLNSTGLTIDGILFDAHKHEVVSVGAPTLGPQN